MPKHSILIEIFVNNHFLIRFRQHTQILTGNFNYIFHLLFSHTFIHEFTNLMMCHLNWFCGFIGFMVLNRSKLHDKLIKNSQNQVGVKTVK